MAFAQISSTDTWLFHVLCQTRANTKLQSVERGSQLLGKSRVNLVEAGELVAEHGGVPGVSQVGGEVGQGGGAGGDGLWGENRCGGFGALVKGMCIDFSLHHVDQFIYL